MKLARRHLVRGAILNCLLEKRSISRKEIALATEISPATVTRVTSQLVQSGMIVEAGSPAHHRRGRRPVLLEFNPNAHYVIGVELGALETRYVLADALGTPIKIGSLPTPTVAQARDLSVWLSSSLAEWAEAVWPDVAALTIGVPGSVSRDMEQIANAPNLPQVEDPAFIRVLRRNLARELLIKNDVDLALLGEQRCGAAKSQKSVALLVFSQGFGASLYRDGSIIQGDRGLIGEFGQLPVGPLGARLESLLTPSGLVRRAQEEGLKVASAKDFFAPQLQDNLARIRSQFDQATLIALTAVTAACEPEMIVIVGELSPYLIDNAKEFENALRQILGFSPKLALPELGEFASAIGAVALGVEHVLCEMGVGPAVARAATAEVDGLTLRT